MSKDMKYSEVRKIVYKRHRGKCAICGKKLALGEMCISLIVPKSKGGYKEFSNMQCTCDSCNRMKHYLTQDEFFRKILVVTLHNIHNILNSFLKGGVS